MKYIKLYKFFENINFFDLKNIVNDLHDICIELEDLGIEYKIFPDNEIRVKILLNNIKYNIPIVDKERINLSLVFDLFNNLSDKKENLDWLTEFIERVSEFGKINNFKPKLQICDLMDSNYLNLKVISDDLSIEDILEYYKNKKRHWGYVRILFTYNH